MVEQKAAIAALSLALLASHVASAQIVSRLEAGTITTGRDGELPTSVLSVSPGIRVDFPLASFSARGSAWLDGQQWEIADGTVSGTLLTPTILNGVLRGEITGNASRALNDRSLGDDQVDGQTRVHVLFKQRGGIWVGGGVARPWRIAVVSTVDVAGGGAWTRLGGAMLSGTFTNFSFTKVAATRDSSGTLLSCSTHTQSLPVGEIASAPSVAASASPADCHRQSRISDLEGNLHWEHGLFELTAHTGYRLGDSYDVEPDSRRWAAATATFWLTSQLAAVLGGGREPASPARGLPARKYVSMGMMLAYWPIPRGTVPVTPRTTTVRAFEARPAAANGMLKIVARVGGVESVDVMGDFSEWNVLTLTRRGRDLWELTVPMSRGVHQINIRVDGGPWTTPPGLLSMRDGYGSEVGMLVVP